MELAHILQRESIITMPSYIYGIMDGEIMQPERARVYGFQDSVYENHLV